MRAGGVVLNVDETRGFGAFVDAHSDDLQRSAFLLAGDWTRAHAAVENALQGAWLDWDSLRLRYQPELYVERLVARRFRSERPRAGRMREVAEVVDPPEAIDTAAVIRGATRRRNQRWLGAGVVMALLAAVIVAMVMWRFTGVSDGTTGPDPVAWTGEVVERPMSANRMVDDVSVSTREGWVSTDGLPPVAGSTISA